MRYIFKIRNIQENSSPFHNLETESINGVRARRSWAISYSIIGPTLKCSLREKRSFAVNAWSLKDKWSPVNDLQP